MVWQAINKKRKMYAKNPDFVAVEEPSLLDKIGASLSGKTKEALLQARVDEVKANVKSTSVLKEDELNKLVKMYIKNFM